MGKEKYHHYQTLEQVLIQQCHESLMIIMQQAH